jgi:hypothetical protein
VSPTDRTPVAWQLLAAPPDRPQLRIGFELHEYLVDDAVQVHEDDERVAISVEASLRAAEGGWTATGVPQERTIPLAAPLGDRQLTQPS